MSERAYRTLVLKYDVLKLPPEAQQKAAKLLEVQQKFRAWVSEWAKSNGRMPLPERNPLKYLAQKFVRAWRALEWLREHVIKHGMRPPLILDAQLRLGGERDVSRGALVDIPRHEIRVRKWSGRRGDTLALPLGEDAVRWILARVREGARLVLAAVWAGPSRGSRAARLCVALIFRREVAPIEARRLLAADLNALHNGIAWAVVERDRVLRRGVLRPDVSKIERLQREISRLDALCARRGGPYCKMAGRAKSKYWRLLREFAKSAARHIARLALQYRAAIVVDAPESGSMQELRQSGSYPADRKALLNFGRLRRLIERLAAWHGAPCIEARLYSTLCPNCGAEMLELQDRRVSCPRCGLEMHRDGVPAMWAQRRFDELLELSKSHTSFSAQFRMLINPRIPVLA